VHFPTKKPKYGSLSQNRSMICHVRPLAPTFTTYVGTLEVEQRPNKMGRKNGVLLGTF